LSQCPEVSPELGVEELRRLDLAVAARARHLARGVAQRVPQRRAVRRPEGAPGRELGEVEEAELAPEAAVVARARLLEALEVLLERLLGEERGAVDPRQHRTLGVAAPVGAGDRLQREGLDRGGARRVRSAAEIGERSVGVERDGLDLLVAHEIVDQLDLVGLILREEALAGRGDGHVLAHERLGGLDVLAHRRLDRREVVLGDRHARREVEVVVEAVLDRRPDR
jgi:hypothetical protein